MLLNQTEKVAAGTVVHNKKEFLFGLKGAIKLDQKRRRKILSENLLLSLDARDLLRLAKSLLGVDFHDKKAVTVLSFHQ